MAAHAHHCSSVMQRGACVLCRCTQVRHETAARLHVKISPAGVRRYEVPETLLPRLVSVVMLCGWEIHTFKCRAVYEPPAGPVGCRPSRANVLLHLGVWRSILPPAFPAAVNPASNPCQQSCAIPATAVCCCCLPLHLYLNCFACLQAGLRAVSCKYRSLQGAPARRRAALQPSSRQVQQRSRRRERRWQR